MAFRVFILQEMLITKRHIRSCSPQSQNHEQRIQHTNHTPLAPADRNTLSQLESSERGLSSAQASERLQQYGRNEIERKAKESLLQLLWRQINNPLIWVLLGSASTALVLGKITDGLVVLAVVVINAIIGFIQEFKAGRAIEALRHGAT